MHEIAFQDFRGFHNQRYIPLKPLTVLIGENSAGKTSYLAGLKYILDFLSSQYEASFNADPFQLGTFDQISHFRGGRGGRARSFKIEFRTSVDIRKDRKSEPLSLPAILTLTFTAKDSHAAIQTVKISSQRRNLEIYDDRGNIRFQYSAPGGERLQFGDEYPTSITRRGDIARIWPFLARDISFRIRHFAEIESGGISESIKENLDTIAKISQALSRQVPIVSDATSAIRTKPQRTYTPGIEKEDGEGTHVPFELAKLNRSRGGNRELWDSIKSSIENFGARSGMFKEIYIKSFGQTASDPFQLQFSSDGPKTNLVDLGYGTSQVLPILYSIQRIRRGNYFLVQQPEVHLHPKAQAALGQTFVDAFAKESSQFVIETHSDFIVDRIRNAIQRGEIDKSNVAILFFERHRLENKVTEIILDDHGEPISPPENYRSFFLKEKYRNLGL